MTQDAAAPPPVHPDRVRAVLDPRLSDATAARLASCGRLRDRLHARLEILGSPHDPAEQPSKDAAWLLADPVAASRRAGALLHAGALREIVSGQAVAALVEAIGREAHLFGLRHAADAMPRETSGGVAAGDLAQAIIRDGFACLGAWLKDSSPGLRRAVLLRLPPGTPAEAERFEPALSERVSAVMACVAADNRESHA